MISNQISVRVKQIWEFKCLKCGQCCQNVTEDGKFSLILIPKRHSIFSSLKNRIVLGKEREVKMLRVIKRHLTYQPFINLL